MKPPSKKGYPFSNSLCCLAYFREILTTPMLGSTLQHKVASFSATDISDPSALGIGTCNPQTSFIFLTVL